VIGSDYRIALFLQPLTDLFGDVLAAVIEHVRDVFDEDL
jgi:hypothetical protein